MKKKLQLTFTLFIISALSGLLISSINSFTAPKINDLNKAKEEAIYKEIFPDLDHADDPILNPTDEIEEQVIIRDKENNIIGYIYKATGVNGYGSITVLTGIDKDQKIKAIKYSSFSQTPGFGDKVKRDVFMDQFVGLPTNNINIDAQAGATYSSDLVGNVVALVSNYHASNVKE